MSIEAYSKGTIKVVWLSEDLNKIHSKMCRTVEEAEKLGKEKGDYLIFSLLKQHKMETFSWELLPSGNYWLYRKLLQFYRWVKRIKR